MCLFLVSGSVYLNLVIKLFQVFIMPPKLHDIGTKYWDLIPNNM